MVDVIVNGIFGRDEKFETYLIRKNGYERILKTTINSEEEFLRILNILQFYKKTLLSVTVNIKKLDIYKATIQDIVPIHSKFIGQMYVIAAPYFKPPKGNKCITKLDSEVAKILGDEYGWLDLVLLRHFTKKNTKVSVVLTQMKLPNIDIELNICDSYLHKYRSMRNICDEIPVDAKINDLYAFLIGYNKWSELSPTNSELLRYCRSIKEGMNCNVFTIIDDGNICVF